MSAMAEGLGFEPREGVSPRRFSGPQQSSALPSFRVAAAIALLLLTACADKPPIISADTSCERFRHISATDAQIKVFEDNWAAMESYADQIVAHNVEYDKKCLESPKVGGGRE